MRSSVAPSVTSPPSTRTDFGAPQGRTRLSLAFTSEKPFQFGPSPRQQASRTNVFSPDERHTSVTLRRRTLSSEIERVYAVRYQAFCRMALMVTGSTEAARDAVQEGFAKALARSEAYRGEGSLEAWLWRIVLRVALDSRSNGRPQVLSLEFAETVLAAELPHPERDPELANALRELPERQRLILFLRYFADLAHADIATLTGIRLGTVSATLNQAKRSLAEHLDRTQLVTQQKGASDE
jgi:RNA polymerase sigma-70 factor (ECF subfamily)